MIVIELAGNPHGKGRPRFSRRSGVAYTPATTRTYESALRYAAQEKMAGAVPLGCPLIVRIEAYFSIPPSWSKRKRAEAECGALKHTTRPDYENIAKCLDAFNGVVWRDDAQVFDGSIVKAYSDRPRLRIIVTPVTSMQAVPV